MPHYHGARMGDYANAWEPDPFKHWDLCPGYDIEQFGTCGRQKRKEAHLCYICSARERAIQRKAGEDESERDDIEERHAYITIAVELGLPISTIMALAQAGGPPTPADIARAVRELGRNF